MKSNPILETKKQQLTEEQMNDILREAWKIDVQNEVNHYVLDECFEAYEKRLDEEAARDIIEEVLLTEAARGTPLKQRGQKAKQALKKAKQTAQKGGKSLSDHPEAVRARNRRLASKTGAVRGKGKSGKGATAQAAAASGATAVAGGGSTGPITLQVINNNGQQVPVQVEPAGRTQRGKGGSKRRKVAVKAKGGKETGGEIITVQGRMYLVVGGRAMPVDAVQRGDGPVININNNNNNNGGGGGGNSKKDEDKADVTITKKSIEQIIREWMAVDPEACKKFLAEALRGGGFRVEEILKKPEAERAEDVVKREITTVPPTPPGKTPPNAPPGTPPPENKREGFLAKTFGFMKKHPVGTAVAIGLLGTVAAASGFGLPAVGAVVAKLAASPTILGALKMGATTGGINLATGLAHDAASGQKRSWGDRLKSAGKAAFGGALGSLAGSAIGSAFSGGGGGDQQAAASTGNKIQSPDLGYSGGGDGSHTSGPLEPAPTNGDNPNAPTEYPDRDPIDYSEIKPNAAAATSNTPDPYAPENNPDYINPDTGEPYANLGAGNAPQQSSDQNVSAGEFDAAKQNMGGYADKFAGAGGATNSGGGIKLRDMVPPSADTTSDGTPPGQNEPDNADNPYGDTPAAAAPAAAAPAGGEGGELTRDQVRDRMTSYAKNNLNMSDEEAKAYGDRQAAGMVDQEPKAPRAPTPLPDTPTYSPPEGQQKAATGAATDGEGEEDNTLDKKGHLRYQDNTGNYSTPGKGRVDTRR